MAVLVPTDRARNHPRWTKLVEKCADDQSTSSTSEQQHRINELKQRFGVSTSSTDAGPSTRSTTTTTISSDVKSKHRVIASQSALGPNYSPQEQTLRNDYSQRFVDTGAGQLPGNAVRNPSSSTRFQEYPKLKRLVQLKDSLVTYVAHPPTYVQADLRPSLAPFRDASRSDDQFHLGGLIPVKYDVVLIDPPLEAYDWEAPPSASTCHDAGSAWSWEQIAALPVPQLAAKESFVFLWVGSGAGDGLERGREVLAKWGYRRCEDIVCIRTNPSADQAGTTNQQPSTSSAFTRTSQHCLMGIRGTVRRSTDARFVHCNIDTDVILWPGPEDELRSHSERAQDAARPENQRTLPDMVSKPPELYQTIENFCLGTRRLELFGRNRNLRRGWLTIGTEVGPGAHGWPQDGKIPLPGAGLPVLMENGMDERMQAHLEALQVPRPYNKVEYDANFGVDRPGCDLRDRSNLVPFIEEVDQLRPKSPPPRGAVDHAVRYRAQPPFNEAPTHRPSTAHMMPSGLSSHPALRTHSHSSQTEHFSAQAYAPHGPLATSTHPIPTERAGAGLSGLGAGGARTVSIPSGSDTLSGPQASVLKAKAIAQAASPDTST